MKYLMFFCLLFVFVAGMNVQGFAEENQGGAIGVGSRGLRIGEMNFPQMDSPGIMKNNSIVQDWPFQVVKNNLLNFAVAAGDFNNDDAPDILLHETSSLLVWYENLHPGWTVHTIDPNSILFGVQFGGVDLFDLNEDGNLDVFVYATTNPGNIVWYKNKMDGMPWEKITINTTINQPANMVSPYGDFDADGDVDLAIPGWGDGKVFWLENIMGDTTWMLHEIDTLSSAIWSTVANMDGDNDVDIVIGSYNSGKIKWYENQLPDTAWPAHQIATLPGTALGKSMDMDDDGDQDIFTHSNISNVLIVYKNPTWESDTLTSGITGMFPGNIGDVDGDLDLDVTYGGENEMGWCENLSSISDWQKHTIDVVENGWPFPEGLVDIDLDSDLDVVTTQGGGTPVPNELRWYANPVDSSGIIRVPEDYPTIQTGIDAATSGDTVLVADSRYYENINFKGKAITVASQFILDNDSSHIENTVIDGSLPSHPDSGSAVYFNNGEDTTSVLCGFTIRGGSGTRHSVTTQSGESIWLREGGGILCDSSGARLVANNITRNRVISGISYGGGISAFGTESFRPFLILEGNHITDNYVQSDTIITWGLGGGAEIYDVSARIVGNVFERDTVMSPAGVASGGLDFQGSPGQSTLPSALIKNNIFRDNWIKAMSSGAIGGGITLAWTDEVIIEGNRFEQNRAICASGSGWAQGGAICITDQDISNYGPKTVTNNHFIGNSVFSESSAFNVNGGGIYIFKTSVTMDANEMIDNTATSNNGSSRPTGGAIGLYQSGFRMENNIIANNMADDYGGGIDMLLAQPNFEKGAAPEGVDLYGAGFGKKDNMLFNHMVSEKGATISRQRSQQPLASPQLFVNNTVYGNESSAYGGGMSVRNSSTVNVMNNIMWANTANIGPQFFFSGSPVNVVYCDVEGSWPGEGNIDVDPLFVSGDSLFHLTDQSPCVDAGVDSIQVGVQWYYCPPYDYEGDERPFQGVAVDIGADETRVVVGIEPLSGAGLPKAYSLDQSYPNPFNPSAIIAYQVPRSSVVRIEIYNILGQSVRTLQNERKEPGVYQVVWDGKNDNGIQVGSGVYLYRMVTEDFVQTRKMILMK